VRTSSLFVRRLERLDARGVRPFFSITL
jgi:hypothetical protein